MILSETLDYLARPIVNIWADDFNEDDYVKPSWMTAYDIPTTPNSDETLFAGITTIHMQDGIIERDTDVFCEYIDTDGEHGFGIIKSWHSNPFDVYNMGTDEDYAFIIRDNGGTTYAFEGNILPLHETDEVSYEPTSDTLPEVFNASANPCNNLAVPSHAVLSDMSPAAHGYIVEAIAS